MDREQLRKVAASRPGYATYPETPPGDPSWWRRPLGSDTPPATPAPDDRCELVAMEGIEVICARADHRHGIQPSPVVATATSAATPAPDTAPAAKVDEEHIWTTEDVERVCAGLGIPIQPWQALLLRQLFSEPRGGARPRPPEPSGFITLTEPPARWWHRFTRRAGR